MAKDVRADALADTGRQGDFLDNLPETVPGHAGAAIGNKQQGTGFAFQNQRPAPFNILLDEGSGGGGKRNDPFFVAFAEDTEVAAAQIAAVHRQVDQLGDAQARGIEQVEHGIVSERQGRGDLREVQEGVDLRDAEDLGEAPSYFRGFNFGDGVDDQRALLVQKKEKGPERRQPAGIRTRADVELVTETEELLDVFLAYTLREERLVVGNKAKKGFQVSTVGCNGIFCQPFLDGEVLEKKLQVIGGVGEVQWRERTERCKKNAPTVEPSGRITQNRLRTRLNLRSLRRASAALRRFLTLGFS